MTCIKTFRVIFRLLRFTLCYTSVYVVLDFYPVRRSNKISSFFYPIVFVYVFISKNTG